MKAFLLLAFIPVLIKADILCPNSKITCPEDKQCCEVDGKYSCCDPNVDEDVPVGRMKVFPGVEFMSSPAFANVSLSSNESILYYDSCNLFSCSGTCCSSSIYGCCPHKMADCCSGSDCCPSLAKCCGSGCCSALQKCCDGKGCCDWDYNCCESWCCKKGSRCGHRENTCVAKGTVIAPELIALILTATSVFVIHRL